NVTQGGDHLTFASGLLGSQQLEARCLVGPWIIGEHENACLRMNLAHAADHLGGPRQPGPPQPVPRVAREGTDEGGWSRLDASQLDPKPVRRSDRKEIIGGDRWVVRCAGPLVRCNVGLASRAPQQLAVGRSVATRRTVRHDLIEDWMLEFWVVAAIRGSPRQL